MELLITQIQFSKKQCLLICDGKCHKAWGIAFRPKEYLDPNDEDNFAYLSDPELGIAPEISQDSAGGHLKPHDKHHNKWCSRECERSTMIESNYSFQKLGTRAIKLNTFIERLYNKR